LGWVFCFVGQTVVDRVEIDCGHSKYALLINDEGYKELGNRLLQIVVFGFSQRKGN
jgi:hypothetical protein